MPGGVASAPGRPNLGKRYDVHNLIDLTGKRFGLLTVLRQSRRRKGSRRLLMWFVLCDCGRTKRVVGAHLRGGNTRSCGCMKYVWLAQKVRTHGMKWTPTWTTWRSMKYRCGNVKNPRYGGRGIKVCKRWRDSFEAFLADMGERPAGTTLDRFPDQDGDYKPGNCRWATNRQQTGNRSSNHLVTFRGRTMTLTEWNRELGFSRNMLLMRLRHGWSVKDAITRPYRPRKRL